MNISKKWLFSSMAVGLVSVLFFIQNKHDEDGVKVAENIVVGESGTLQNQAAKGKNEKNSIQIKAQFNHNHIIDDSDLLEQAEDIALFDNSDIGIYLEKHLNMLEDTAEGSQERQDKSLEKMRETPALYVDKLTEAYDKIERVDFLDRYKLVYLMENIQTAHALPFLAELAASENPEETVSYKGDGHIDEAQNESLIRMRAVGGLYALAKKGEDEARQVLFDTVLNTKDRTVKNDAIWYYLSTSNNLEADKDYLKTVLPETDHQLVTAKLSNIEEVQEKMESFDENELVEDSI